MRMKPLGAAILTALILVAVRSATAAAQERPEEPDIPPDVRARGRRLQDEARAHVEAERWALAAEAYRELYDFSREHGAPQAPIALWNVGLALLRVPGREAEARDAFQRFLDESTTLTDDPQVRDWRSTALEHIAELEARISSSDASATGDDDGDAHAPNDAHGSNDVPAPSSGGGISPIGPVLLGTGVLSLGVAGVFGALALTCESDLRNRCGGLVCLDTPEHRGINDEMRLFGGVTDVLLVAGGLVAVTGLILTFTLTEGGAGSATTATATLRPGGAQLAIGVSF